MLDPIDDPPEFTREQLQRALRQVGEDARKAAFAVNRPVMILRDGRLVLQFADGSEKYVNEPSAQP